MPSVLWNNFFKEYQGYGVNDNIIYQENKRAILLENNGKSSIRKLTKHINIRYFFVTDRIHKGDMSVECCTTDKMNRDFLNKPNQGYILKRFIYLIMGFMPQTDPNNRKKGNIKKKKTNKYKQE